MTTFNILVLVGGLVGIFLLSVFFIFIAPQIEKKYKKALGLFFVIYLYVIAFLMIPASQFCEDQFLRSQYWMESRHLLSRWVLFLGPTGFYWIFRYRKKQKEIEMKNQMEVEKVISESFKEER
jgi:prolipoprotein diacylglyceryltransferase